MSILDTRFNRQAMLRAIVAGTAGSSVEFYDFVLSANAAVLIFPRIVFPGVDPMTGVLLAFSTYAAGFMTRPVGAAVFGHFGDRMGRKSTLVATLLIMGLVSTGIGLLPGYAQIGVWSGVLLTTFRLLQGFAIGGEWGGTILLPLEWGPPERRGLVGSCPDLGFPSGLVTSNLVLILCRSLLGTNFLVWGWRIPFLLGGALILLGLYVRLGVLETPAFVRLLEEHRIVQFPVLEVLRRNWRDIVLAALALQPPLLAFYMWTTFALHYGTIVLKLSASFMLVATLSAAIVSLFAVVVFGHLSDRFGYKRIYLLGVAAFGELAFPYFWLVDTRAAPLVLLASVLGLLTFALQYGPLPAFVSSIFSGQVRYTGVSLSYHLAAAVGGLAPLIATALLQLTKSSAPVAGYMAISALVAVRAGMSIRNRSHLDHRIDYDQQEWRDWPAA